MPHDDAVIQIISKLDVRNTCNLYANSQRYYFGALAGMAMGTYTQSTRRRR
ncbi:Uncharacterised protein [Yersinia intermedia]|nr:Uncharacterised protein [Yersinia intermedia]